MGIPQQNTQPHAAEDISQRNRQEIPQKESFDGQAAEVNARLLGEPEVLRVSDRQESGGYVIHIGDTVFKTADDKVSHRDKGPHKAACSVPGGKGQEDPQTDQKIAEDAKAEAAKKGNAALGGGKADGIRRESSGGVVQLTEEHAPCRRQERSQEVPQIDDPPVSQEAGEGAFVFQQGDCQEAVPGKKLRACNNDHTKAKGKKQSADRPCQAHIGHTVDGGTGGGAGEGDEDPRQR